LLLRLRVQLDCASQLSVIRHGAALRVQHRLLLLLLLLLLHFKGVASDKARLLQLENDAFRCSLLLCIVPPLLVGL
jgi:hypothetical protein